MAFSYYIYSFIFWLSFTACYFLSNNLFMVLVYTELAALSVGVLLIIHSVLVDDLFFEVFTIALITLAGAESALAVSLLVGLSYASVKLWVGEFVKFKV